MLPVSIYSTIFNSISFIRCRQPMNSGQPCSTKCTLHFHNLYIMPNGEGEELKGDIIQIFTKFLFVCFVSFYFAKTDGSNLLSMHFKLKRASMCIILHMFMIDLHRKIIFRVLVNKTK